MGFFRFKRDPAVPISNESNDYHLSFVQKAPIYPGAQLTAYESLDLPPFTFIGHGVRVTNPFYFMSQLTQLQGLYATGMGLAAGQIISQPLIDPATAPLV